MLAIVEYSEVVVRRSEQERAEYPTRSSSLIITFRSNNYMVFSFPPLPITAPPNGWPASALQAHQQLLEAHIRIQQALAQEGDDPAHLRALEQQIHLQYIPLLQTFQEAGIMSEEWLREAGRAYGSLLPELEDATAVAQHRYVALQLTISM